MPTFAKLGSEIFRAYATDGVPGSGAHKPIKADVRTWMATVEGFTPIEGRSTIASAATVDLGANRSWQVAITGTTTITSFGTAAATGALKWLYFSGALTVNHSSTLICPNAANIATSAGSCMLVGYEGSNVWRVIYHRSGDGSQGFGVEPSGAWADIKAGTTSKAPLKFRSGSNLTTAAAGAAEFDGKAFYLTPADSARAVVPVEHFICLAADASGSNVNTAQDVFPSAGAVNLVGSTTYFFEAEFIISRTAGTTSHTTSLLIAGGATYTSLRYFAEITNPTGNVLAAVQRIYGTSAGAVVLTAANTSATENLQVRVTGVLRVNAGGAMAIRYQFSAAPGGAPTIKANSFLRVTPVGASSVGSVGNWS